MKIDVTRSLEELDGDPIPDQTVVDGRIVTLTKHGEPVVLTLRTICQRALLGTIAGLDEHADGKTKVQLYDLAVRITKEDEPDLKDEERVRIKDRIGRMFGPLVVGQAYALLSD